MSNLLSFCEKESRQRKTLPKNIFALASIAFVFFAKKKVGKEKRCKLFFIGTGVLDCPFLVKKKAGKEKRCKLFFVGTGVLDCPFLVKKKVGKEKR